MDRLKGKVAVVTGASRGIGRGVARAFGREGASVVLAARTEDRLAAVAESIEAEGGAALPFVTDVSQTVDLRRMIDAAIEQFGGLDILVNNAAVTFFRCHLDDENMEAEYDRLMATNVKSAWMAIHYGLPHMKARGGGSILNISSVHGTASGGHMSAYAASKGALDAGTRAMAVELAPHRIRVNCISPGRIWLDEEPDGWIKRRLGPDLHAEFVERFGDWMEKSRTLQQPLPVAGLPEDIAACAVYLASDEARFVTGANFLVDGGMTAQLSDPNMMSPGVSEALTRQPEIRAWMEDAHRRAGELRNRDS